MAQIALETPASDTSLVGELPGDDDDESDTLSSQIMAPSAASRRRGSAVEFFTERRDTAVSKQNTEQACSMWLLMQVKRCRFVV
jgi:hypothetical protein